MNEVTVDRGTHLAELPHVWGWEIPLYLFFAGVTAGIMLLTVTLWKRRPLEQRSRWLRRLPFAAPITLGLGMLVLFPHLSYKAHAWRFFTVFHWTSPMSWEAWILLFTMPATILLALAGLNNEEAGDLSRWRPVTALRLSGLVRWARRLAVDQRENVRRLNLVLGVALAAYPGFLLGTLVARPAWHSAMMVPLFLVSAILTGAALMRLFPLHAEEHSFLRAVNLKAIGLQVALIAVFVLWLASGDLASQQAAQLFLGGPFTALFWALVVVAGLVVPFVLELDWSWSPPVSNSPR